MATKRKKKAKPKTNKKKTKLVKSSRKKIRTKKKVRTKKSATKKRSKISRKNNKLKLSQLGVKLQLRKDQTFFLKLQMSLRKILMY